MAWDEVSKTVFSILCSLVGIWRLQSWSGRLRLIEGVIPRRNTSQYYINKVHQII